MSINFSWMGSVGDAAGKASYTINNSTYELWLPTFEKARQLEDVLRDIFEEGRRVGQLEMKQAATTAMNEVTRR